MRLCLFQFSLRDQASNWLECLPAGSITTWKDFTTRFLAQFFPPGRTAKLRNDILMFQQHHGESLSKAWTRFKDLLQKFPHHGIDLWLQVQIFYDHVIPVTRRTIDQSAGVVSTTLSIASMTLSKLMLTTHPRTQTKWEERGNSMAPKSIAAISHVEKEELRKKGIKSPSKFFSPKYLPPASIKELNKNPSAPKRVHFVNSIVILSKDSDTKEDVSSTNVCRHDLEVESEFETDEEVEEILEEEEEEEDDENFNPFLTMKELSHHEWLLKNPRPPLRSNMDELHVTLAHLEKKRQDYIPTPQISRFVPAILKTASQFLRDAVTTHPMTASRLKRDVVTTFFL
ncbi:zinc finger, CCHC-type containing protein [Tanacetum coccineum]